MKRKVLWSVVSSLMALSLVMAACAQVATPTAPATPVTPASPASPATPVNPAAPVAPTTPTTPRAAEVEGPKYGGWVNYFRPTDITSYDEVVGWQAPAYFLQATNGDLLRGNWARGPAGTGEIKFQSINRYDYKIGNLAESWEMPQPGHWIMHIRKGVRFATNPASWAEASRLVNGREFTAYDAEYALKTYVSATTSYIYRSFPGLRHPEYITATDKTTLEIKVPATEAMNASDMFFDFATVDIPKEVNDKYGNMTNWKNSVGTGPFILSDYTPGGSATLTRNPNYWMKDPVGAGKGNKLPYVDGVRVLILPDASTRLAAFRTGKLDSYDVVWEDLNQVKKTMPQALYRMSQSGGSATVGMRQDKADKPFRDIRVRRALTMAIDYDTLVKTLTGGTGLKLGYPGMDTTFIETWVSWDEAPESVKELYTYNPEKAKQLLKEAGYPNGFKANIVLQSTSVDSMSILKDMWAKVGVQLVFDLKDSGTFAGLTPTRNYDEMITGVGLAGGIRGTRFRGEGQVNISYVSDKYVNDLSDKINETYLINPSEAIALWKKALIYAYDQAWTISIPTSGPGGTFWWPWLKNFYGDQSIGYFDYLSGFQFAWIDQNMKKSMGY